jgi:hypothetical protein
MASQMGKRPFIIIRPKPWDFELRERAIEAYLGLERYSLSPKPFDDAEKTK